jgi:hypothetical protein
MVIPYGLVIRIVKLILEYFSDKVFRQKYSPKYEGDELNRKVKKSGRAMFKIVYFSFMFLLGWTKVLGETPFCPPIMFGDGELMKVFSDWPYTTMPKFLKFYYIMSISYYIEDLIVHIFQTPNSDYFEMILHHIVAAMLIFSSYMNGFWNIGIFVLVQMDISDFFIGIVRLIMDFAGPIANFIVYIFIMSSWFHFRFLAYVKCVLWTFGLGGRLSVDNYTDVVTVIDFLLVALLGLNIYWFILLGMMGYRLAFKGQSHDLQNIVSQKELQS